jgi:hypothetical protein
MSRNPHPMLFNSIWDINWSKNMMLHDTKLLTPEVHLLRHRLCTCRPKGSELLDAIFHTQVRVHILFKNRVDCFELIQRKLGKLNFFADPTSHSLPHNFMPRPEWNTLPSVTKSQLKANTTRNVRMVIDLHLPSWAT